ncbi:MAG: methyltransferase domain-containing protein [Verrucomicrobiota bacterium]
MASVEEKAKQRYQGSLGLQYHHAKRAIPEQAFPWVARLRLAKIAPYVRPSDTVLEYGVGLGWNLAAVACARKLGYDVGAFLEPQVRLRGIEFRSDLEALPGASMDVVICHHTLEHTAEPAQVLSTIHRLLRAGGRLLLFVPFERERRFRHFDRTEPNHHLYSWNVQTLGNLVLEAGFEVEQAGLGRFGQERFAARVASRLHGGERGFRVIRWIANTLKNEREVRVVATKLASSI